MTQRRLPSTDTPVPITFLTTGLGMGGAETQLVRIASHLDSRRWQPSLISMLPPEHFGDELADAGVPTFSLGMVRGKPSVQALVRAVGLLRTLRPQVLVCFLYHANLLGRIAGRIARVPVISSSVRNQNFGGRWRELVMRHTDWLGDLTTTNSRQVADHLISRGVVSSLRVRVVPNALADSFFASADSDRSAMRASLGLHENEFVWLAVGRLAEAKDYPTLLAAFHLILQERARVRLLIAGQGSLLNTLKDKANELDLGDRVIFLGLRKDIPALLATADAFVLSSAWEGLPNVVMEAMAAGKPVVATRVGGTSDLVTDGETGFLVPPGEPGMLAQQMVRLMDLPPQQSRLLGENGQTQVRSQFGTSQVVDRWDALFRELLSRKLTT